jgi:hypothetical protein
MRNEGSALRYE